MAHQQRTKLRLHWADVLLASVGLAGCQPYLGTIIEGNTTHAESGGSAATVDISDGSTVASVAGAADAASDGSGGGGGSDSDTPTTGVDSTAGCTGTGCTCTPEAETHCHDGDVHWFDSCGVPGALQEDCGMNEPVGPEYCAGANLYHDVAIVGCEGDACTSDIIQMLVQDCGVSGCSAGACVTCADDCNGGDAMCVDPQTVQSCGNYDGDACLEFGGAQACMDGQTCSGGECGCDAGAEGQFSVLTDIYPSFGPPGCAGDGSLALKASAAMISPTTLRVYVRKQDDTAFAMASTLTIYVGEGPTCKDPPNVSKTTKAVVVGLVQQAIDLTVNPYDGAWPVGEAKEFWVGKDEGGFMAFRSTGIVNVRRDCIP